MKMNGLTFWEGIALVVVMITLDLLFSALLFDLSLVDFNNYSFSVVNVLSMGVMISVLMATQHLSYRNLFHPTNIPLSKILVKFIPGMSLFIAGTWWWFLDLWKFLIPFDGDIVPSLEPTLILSESGWITLIAICLIAPFTEEILFRGIMLRGFLKNYSADKAILYSSLIFGLIHFNWHQIPAAFLLGMFLGWLFVISRSLWPSIIAHALYNAGVYWEASESDYQKLSELEVNITALVISMIGLFLLFRVANTVYYEGNSKEDNHKD